MLIKNVLVVNLNVGSAIEYAGDVITDWIKEAGYNVKVYKEQTEAGALLREFNSFKPDLIVLNEDYHRPHVATFLYRRMLDYHVPLIYINHCWNKIVDWGCKSAINYYEEMVRMWYRHTLHTADYIFCLNQKPDEYEWPREVRGKISNRYYPTDPSMFHISTPWEERKDYFCYIGNIIPHKLSQEFLEKLPHVRIPVWCYGREYPHDDEYKKAFEYAKDNYSIRYRSLTPQEEIPQIMNKYKYLVLPHDGYEPFNWVVKQCLYCGTIPLVVTDKDLPKYFGKWLDWAKGLYFGCDTVDDLLYNMEEIVIDIPDYSNISRHISNEAMRRFPYQEFKEEFQEKVRELLNG